MSKSNRFIGNSSSINGNSSRFSVLDEPSTPKENTNTRRERGSNSFLNSRGNSRFESLKDELVPIVNDSNSNSNSNTISNRGNSFRSATVVKKVEPILIIKENDFPELLSSCPKKPETSVNKWAAIVKKEVVVEVKEEEYKKVSPGWVCFRKNKETGKTETIKGPLTEEQKHYDRLCYLEKYDLKYNMFKTIERMSAGWEEYRQQFDERYGQGAYQEKYGEYLSYGNNDDDDDEYNEESDSDSEYEYE